MLLQQSEYGTPPARYTGGMHAAGSSTSGQLGQLQRQPPALPGAYHPLVSHAAQISPIRDSLATPRLLLDAFADVATGVSGLLHGIKRRAYAIPDGLVFVASKGHDRELKFRTLRL